MPKTAVGLFEDPRAMDDALRQIETLGFPRNEVRSLKEPDEFEITGVTSFPRLDYEVELRRDLTTIGATKPEIEAYVTGLRRGGTLLFATGSEKDTKVDAAVDIMNRCGAVGVGETVGAQPQLPRATYADTIAPTTEDTVQAGRLRQPADGATAFVW